MDRLQLWTAGHPSRPRIAGASSRAEGLAAGLLFIGLLAGSFAAIVARELGHALAAWAVGWRVWIVSALPVCLRLGLRPRLSAEPRRDVGGCGGMILAEIMTPRGEPQERALLGMVAVRTRDRTKRVA